MAETLDRIYRLTVDGTAAARQLGEIERATASLDSRLAGAGSALKAFGGILAAAFSAQAVIGSIQRNIDAMDELAKAVQKVGIGAEDLQKLRYAADLSGVAAETLDKSIGKLAVSMTDLKTGSTDAHKALRALGAKSGDSPTEALAKIADQFAKMPDGIEKTALAIKVFGKAGAELIPLLNGGADGLKELGDEAQRFGGILSDTALANAEAFNDNLSRLQRTLGGVSAQITAGMLPALVAISGSLTAAAKSGDGFVGVGKFVGDTLIDLYTLAIQATNGLKDFAAVFNALQQFKEAPGAGLAIFKAMTAQIGANAAAAKLQLLELKLAMFDAANAPPAVLKDQKKPLTDPAEDALKRQKEAQKELERLEKTRAAAAAALVQIAKDEAQVLDDLGKQQERYRKAAEDSAKANQAFIDSLDPAGAALETYFAGMAKLQELQEASAITAERRIALEKVLAENLHKTGGAAAKQKDELQILNDGFTSFFTNLANGAASVEDVFKRMVQSILAELLKIWAQKYIINMLFPGSGGTAPTGGGGITAPRFAMPSFAAPSAIVGPSGFATSTSTGAAISPLRFGGSGNLSLPAQQQPAMQVTINNNAAGVQVETRQTPGGLEVNIDQIRAALSADILRGGNVMAHAAERAWGLSRGNAAAF